MHLSVKNKQTLEALNIKFTLLQTKNLQCIMVMINKFKMIYGFMDQTYHV